MGLIEVLLNEGTNWPAIEKKINALRKKVNKIDDEVWMIQKAIRKAGGEPEDWTSESSYATENIIAICDKMQEVATMFKE